MSDSAEARKITDGDIIYFQNQMLIWFESMGRHHLPWRKEGLSPFEIVIAEVLLQRTKAETIEKFYPGFLKSFPNWQTIANSETVDLERALKPVGLYKQRAKRLKDLAVEMVNRNGQLPLEREELEQIPFLGQYLVNAIELQVFYKPRPLLDVNMSRVLERYFGKRKMADIRYDPYLQEVATRVVDHPQSREINWAILDFAAFLCKAAKPVCVLCPLKNKCIFEKTVNECPKI